MIQIQQQTCGTNVHSFQLRLPRPRTVLGKTDDPAHRPQGPRRFRRRDGGWWAQLVVAAVTVPVRVHVSPVADDAERPRIGDSRGWLVCRASVKLLARGDEALDRRLIKLQAEEVQDVPPHGLLVLGGRNAVQRPVEHGVRGEDGAVLWLRLHPENHLSESHTVMSKAMTDLARERDAVLAMTVLDRL
jgi:hypothetical protein